MKFTSESVDKLDKKLQENTKRNEKTNLEVGTMKSQVAVMQDKVRIAIQEE